MSGAKQLYSIPDFCVVGYLTAGHTLWRENTKHTKIFDALFTIFLDIIWLLLYIMLVCWHCLGRGIRIMFSICVLTCLYCSWFLFTLLYSTFLLFFFCAMNIRHEGSFLCLCFRHQCTISHVAAVQPILTFAPIVDHSQLCCMAHICFGSSITLCMCLIMDENSITNGIHYIHWRTFLFFFLAV